MNYNIDYKYIYNDCIKRIKKHGERFSKKHGEWYRIKVLDKWLLLDTLNWSINLCSGCCDPIGKDNYGNITGFYSNSKELLAINFGHFMVG